MSHMKKLLLVLLIATLPTMARAQNGPPAAGLAVPNAFSLKQPLVPSWWAQISLGYDYTFFGDLNKGCQNVANYAQALDSLDPGTTNGSSVQTGNSGTQEAVELGFQLNRESALYLKMENDWSQSMGWSRTDDGVLAESFKVAPLLWGASLNFEQGLIRSNWGRTFFTIGGGAYFADFNATYYNGNLNQTFTDMFTGTTWGAALSLGQAVELGGHFSLEFSVEGRWITFNQLTSATPPGPNFVQGPYYLSIVQNQNFGQGFSSNTDYLLWTAQQIANLHPGDYRYAVADFSGVNGVFSLRYAF